MVYSQLVFINEGSAEVLMILVQDVYWLNLYKTLGELGQQIEMNLHLLAKSTKCFRQVQLVEVLKKIMRTSAEPELIHTSWLFTVNINV